MFAGCTCRYTGVVVSQFNYECIQKELIKSLQDILTLQSTSVLHNLMQEIPVNKSREISVLQERRTFEDN